MIVPATVVPQPPVVLDHPAAFRIEPGGKRGEIGRVGKAIAARHEAGDRGLKLLRPRGQHVPLPPRGHESLAGDDPTVDRQPAVFEHERMRRHGPRRRRGTRQVRNADRFDHALGLAMRDGRLRLASEPLPQLRVVEALRLDRLIELLPEAVAHHLAPRPDRPVGGRRRHPALHDAGRADPRGAVRRCPADPLVGDLAIREREPAAIDLDVVVEHARRPAAERPAIAMGSPRHASHERIWPRRQMTHAKILATVLGHTVADEHLPTANEERPPPPAADFGPRSL